MGVLGVLAPWAPAAAQEAAERWVHPDYFGRQWTVRDGLPSNLIDEIAISPEGYVWLEATDEIVRFDGSRFATFDSENTEGLRRSLRGKLLQDQSGAIWVVHDGQLMHYEAGDFTRLEAPDSELELVDLLLVEADTVWIATETGLARSVEGQVQPYRPDLIGTEATAVARDPRGMLWIGTETAGLLRMDPNGTTRHFTQADGLSSLYVFDLHVDREGAVWAALGPREARPGVPAWEPAVVRITGERVETRYEGRQWRPRLHPIEEELWVAEGWVGWERLDTHGDRTVIPLGSPERSALGPARDRNGHLWRAETGPRTPDGNEPTGIVYRDTTRVLVLPHLVTDIAVDDRGSVWVGTNNQGLFRLSEALVRTLTTEDGLPHQEVFPVLEDPRGGFWVGTGGGGIARLDDSLRVVQRAEELPPHPQNVMSLYLDPQQHLWVGTRFWVCRMGENGCEDLALPLSEDVYVYARAIHEDRQGRVWIGLWNHVLVGEAGDAGWSWSAVPGSPGEVVIIEELRDGSVLFGTREDGLLRYAPGIGPGSDFEALTVAHSLPSDEVRSLYEDEGGDLWIGVVGHGLCRLDRAGQGGLQGGTLACVDARDGLDDGPYRMLEDAEGRLWVNTVGGLFWIFTASLHAHLDGHDEAVAPVAYTELQGMRYREGNGERHPAGLRARDGRLLFPTMAGLVIIDPSQVPVPDAPTVVVQGVQVEGRPRAVAAPLRLGPEERELEIHFGAVEYDYPESVRFQYRLVGYDETWRPARGTRQATFANLPPGSYTFEVRAALGGAWGAATRMPFERTPFFRETFWFRLLVILGLGVALAGLYQYRLGRLRRREAELEQTVAERTVQLRDQQGRLEAQTVALQEANEVKSRFLANISHEFRTPLTLTFGPLDDLLGGRFEVEPAARPHLQRARRNGRRLLRLINQLLELSRLDAGALALQPAHLELGRFLREITALFGTVSEQQGLHLSVDVPEEPVWRIADPGKLEMIVVNLLSNAFKFTPRGGTVTVTLAPREDEGVCIAVADTGAGIPEELLPHLFDRFYQVEQAATRSHEGSGIGLALVRELVALHGGTISVESTLGRGTRFELCLPLLPEAEAEASGTEASGSWEEAREDVALAAAAATTRMPAPVEEADVDEDVPTVLVVEDNADMRAYIRGHLDDTFAIVEAADGRQGLALALEWVPDLVLSDVMMPEMDGLALTQALKADRRTSHIPVVLLTARAEVSDRIAGFEQGADAYLPKPFDGEELRVRVRALVEERRRLRVLFAAPRKQAGGLQRSAPQATHEEKPVQELLPPTELAFLAQVDDAVRARLGDAGFGVDALAEAVDMSRRQLTRKLKALTDEAPGAMLRRMRLERGAELLGLGASVKEVAHAVGYADYRTFWRAFTTAYGTSPTDYDPSADDPPG